MKVIPTYLQGYFYIDGALKPVTFYRQTSGSTYDSGTALNVQWRPQRTHEAEPSSGAYQLEEVNIRVLKAQLSVTPQVGDTVNNGTNTYVIGANGVREVGALGAWECSLARPFLKDVVDTTISIYRPQPTQDSSYRLRRGTETTVATGIPAYLQLQDPTSVEEDMYGKMAQAQAYSCYISQTISGLQPHDRIVDAAGVSYSYEGTVNLNRIGVFQHLIVYRRP